MEQYLAFQWHITDSCDQRCQHCYIFSEDNDIPIIEMSYEKMEHVLENCMDMCKKLNRIPYFYITGGDPILHKDFWTFMEMLKFHNVSFGLLGNPFHLNDEICKKLRYYGCDKYQLSIDGMRNNHDSIRKPGSFDTTIEKIKCIRNEGIKCVVMTTVSKINIAEIPQIIDLVAHHHVDIFAFARYCPTSLEKSTHIESNEYKELLEICWEKFKEYKDSGTTFNLKDHLWTLFLYEKGLFTIPEGLDDNKIYDGCNCANCHMTILPNGDVYACRRMESLIGNAFSESMQDIFLGEKMDKYRQYDKFEKCSKCELLRFCRGCPAVAYGYTHNAYAADPQCWKEI
ncbi:radical SAM/SPASM domain protein, ACGX system [Clostridium akagii]|uniref:radical SAM/SPASM domain protein, ACGX system n=1 Tax=Clostridium akagii TaxID=91623 RepID=UPI00047BCD2E|nr:radical SAM/SPASM domain protein, ACGX system [Clostridium akagii]